MNLLDFNIPEWAFIAVNLIILTAVLSKIFWKPVNRRLDERRAQVEQGLKDAAQAKAEKEAVEAAQAAFEADMHRQTAEQMKAARVRAGHEYNRIVAEAEEKARKQLAASHAQARQEKEAMLATAKAEIVAASLEMTGLLLEANMNSEQNQRLVEAYLDRDSAAVSAGKDVSA